MLEIIYFYVCEIEKFLEIYEMLLLAFGFSLTVELQFKWLDLSHTDSEVCQD